ncbi:23S rRNA (adenine(2030)-N(6))-methyltransferase RlmJ [Ahrensia sp. 13_GOM-1096m]|uniref:23S rRNA (adenine(2030)-N(6))-methyltransferase RlmJ n=1 Tax=Ahrensia sp. 13_GOM-1096m TaxID=1380380 RepID=UPI00047DAACB|nr:23S rRNA (adenine(2030)-N(6))-methyltransferase RlmJ [Ahrensia sp. 13_GOM-1096m]
MNYRHAYHAGNFADVVKHIILTRVLMYFKRKDAPFFVMDTHAGVGRYDLKGVEAQKTREAETGIARLIKALPNAPKEVRELCEPFTTLLNDMNEDKLQHYPGSPMVAQSLIRRTDRLSLVELHPEDFDELTINFNWAKNTKTHHLDAWQAMKAQLPPNEKRGLILVDPPFEDRDEFNAILRALYDAQKRFSKGTYMLWYPIKDLQMIASFSRVLSGMDLGRTLDVRVMIDRPGSQAKFIGTGMVIVNPPYVLEKELKVLLPWLVKLFEVVPGSGSHSIYELVGEQK